MARTDNLTNFLTDVADAIRNKKGSSEAISASSFDSEIASITTGTAEDLTEELIEQDNLLTTQETTIDEIFSSLQNKIAGSEISLQEKIITPTTSQQNVVPDSKYNGLSKVVVNAVTSAIDDDIKAGNIKKGVSILGVTGTLEEGIIPTGTLPITENGIYDVTNYASALVNIASSGSSSDAVSGSFTPVENYTSANQYFEFNVGFKPSEVIVYRKTWVRGTQSINITFKGAFNFSVCNTAGSSKAVEKLVGSSYITVTDAGFKITGNSSYYLVGGAEYIYIAIP